MANKVTTTTTNNKVIITPQSDNNISNSTTNTSVTVTQGNTSIVTVNTLGPQGIQGRPGESPGLDNDIQVRHITASGNISASGQFLGSNFGLDSTDKLEFSDNTLQFRLNDGSRITHTPTIFRPTSDEGVSLGRSNEKWKELVVNHITASGNISASGDIFADTASFFNIILDHRGTAEPTITFESDGGPDFTLGFSGDNVLQLSGETGASGQVFELASEVETFRMKSGGTIFVQAGNNAGTGSKHDGGLFIERQDSTNSNGKAAQFTALNTGGVLKNTSFGGTGKHGTFKFINGGNLSNAIDSAEHVVAEFGPTSSAHFTFHVPITASGNISASGTVESDGLILSSPNGTRYKIIVDNDGNLSTTSA